MSAGTIVTTAAIVFLIDDDYTSSKTDATFLKALDTSSQFEFIIIKKPFIANLKKESAIYSDRLQFFIQDLALDSDLTTGVRAGIELCREIKKINTNAEPILLSGNTGGIFDKDIRKNFKEGRWFAKELENLEKIFRLLQKDLSRENITNEIVVNIGVRRCIGKSGDDLVKFDEYDFPDFYDAFYTKPEEFDPLCIKANFIAKCFLITPKPFLRKGHIHFWETVKATWEVYVAKDSEELPTGMHFTFRKVYHPETKRIVGISFPEKEIEFSVKDKDSFKDAFLSFKETEGGLRNIERKITEYFFCRRLAEMFIDEQLEQRKTIELAENLATLKNDFLFYLWELIMLKSQDYEGGQKKMEAFYKKGFVRVQDIFYCQVEKTYEKHDKQNKGFLGVGVKSVTDLENPFFQNFPIDYLPVYSRHIHKPFKIVYYKDPLTDKNETAPIEPILQEEYEFLHYPF